jgi:hypothetical protein
MLGKVSANWCAFGATPAQQGSSSVACYQTANPEQKACYQILSPIEINPCLASDALHQLTKSLSPLILGAIEALGELRWLECQQLPGYQETKWVNWCR